MLVGHMPDLACLCSYLVAGEKDLDIMFKKAAVCKISFDGKVSAGYGVLEWLIQPKVLRQLEKLK